MSFLHQAGRFWAKFLFGMLLILGISVSACSTREQGSLSGDRKNTLFVSLGIYTPGTKLPLGKPLQASRGVAQEYMRRHPETRIKFIQQVDISGSQEGDWLKTQLVGGIAPDIIQQNAEVAWTDVDKGWYMPLDDFLAQPNPYVPGNRRWMDIFLNQALVNAKRAPDSKLYCLSIDIVETAIYYNKTLFDSLGLRIPETWQEFIALQQALRDAGYTPLASFKNLSSDWGQDIIFDMLYYGIIDRLDVEPSLETQKAYLTHYLSLKEVAFLFRKGFFTPRDPRWVEMYRILKEWRGYWSKELKNTDASYLFLTHRAAMVWDGSWFARRLLLDPYIDFEWGIFYLPKITRATSRFAVGVEASVIGGAAIQLHVTNSAQHFQHLPQVIDYLMFITAPQNLEPVTNEAMMFLPNVKGVRMAPELAPIHDIFQRRYCSIKWLESFDTKYKSDWRRLLDLFLNDGISLQDYLARLQGIFARYLDEKARENKWDFSDYEATWQKNPVALE